MNANTKIFSIILFLILACFKSSADKHIPAAPCETWQNVVVTGKLKADGLPVRPSVKIFMRHNELIRIAVSAPFLGEVARIEITPDEMLAINKIRNTYCREYLKDIMPASVGEQLILANIQDLILCRPVTIGDTLFRSDGPGIQSGYDKEEDMTWSMTDYNFDGNSVTMLQMFDSYEQLVRQYIIGMNADTQYSHTEWAIKFDYTTSGEKKNIEIGAEFNDKILRPVTIECNPPKWETEGIDPPRITSKMKRVGIGEFLSAF